LTRQLKLFAKGILAFVILLFRWYQKNFNNFVNKAIVWKTDFYSSTSYFHWCEAMERSV